MKRPHGSFGPWIAAAVAAASACPLSGWSCAACFGQSDSAMAAGMNWGIFSLLAMILLMLGGVAGFFIFIARRAAHIGAATGAGSAGSYNPAWTGEMEPLSLPRSARGGLHEVSALAQTRKDCAPSPARLGRKSPLSQRRAQGRV